MDGQQFQSHMHALGAIHFELQALTNLIERGVRTGTGQVQPNGANYLPPAVTGPEAAMQQPVQQLAQQPAIQQPVTQFQQPTLQQPVQQGAMNVTADSILELVTPLLENPNARPMLQQAMQAMGIGALPEAKPEQYAELYARFSQVRDQINGASQQFAQPQQTQQFQQPVQQFAQPQQFQQQQPVQQFAQQQPQQFAPQGGGII